ncbi:hypothetical protein HMPREF9396_2051 [Streptococcus sanguinis SK1059]|nr:hypothetical protein HMPREF9396_2051 [Streptococcus sanguinis SK1059]EGQ18886.1 hypothetical protein HMPREF8573_2028 [Streptococcus sanguinis ATCC 29667]EGQ25331.1 hypothetical protein HMPREF9387_0366 [Streptococcus sanguinis SK340]
MCSLVFSTTDFFISVPFFSKNRPDGFLFYRPSITDTENFVQYFFKKDYF